MLRYSLAALAALVLLTASLIPEDADAPVAEVAAIGAVAEATAAALSQFEDLGAAALSQCAAQAIGVGPIAATRYRGYGVGAAAVGAAAVGAAAAGAYRSGCGYDAYGNWICPGY